MYIASLLAFEEHFNVPYKDHLIDVKIPLVYGILNILSLKHIQSLSNFS